MWSVLFRMKHVFVMFHKTHLSLNAVLCRSCRNRCTTIEYFHFAQLDTVKKNWSNPRQQEGCAREDLLIVSSPDHPSRATTGFAISARPTFGVCRETACAPRVVCYQSHAYRSALLKYLHVREVPAQSGYLRHFPKGQLRNCDE